MAPHTNAYVLPAIMELFVKVSIKLFNHSIIVWRVLFGKNVRRSFFFIQNDSTTRRSTDITGVALCNMLDKLNIKKVFLLINGAYVAIILKQNICIWYICNKHYHI
jgi:hypothetical protein